MSHLSTSTLSNAQSAVISSLREATEGMALKGPQKKTAKGLAEAGWLSLDGEEWSLTADAIETLDKSEADDAAKQVETSTSNEADSALADAAKKVEEKSKIRYRATKPEVAAVKAIAMLASAAVPAAVAKLEATVRHSAVSQAMADAEMADCPDGLAALATALTECTPPPAGAVKTRSAGRVKVSPRLDGEAILYLRSSLFPVSVKGGDSHYVRAVEVAATETHGACVVLVYAGGDVANAPVPGHPTPEWVPVSKPSEPTAE